MAPGSTILFHEWGHSVDRVWPACAGCGLPASVCLDERTALEHGIQLESERFTRDCRLAFVCAECGATTDAPGGEVLNTLAWHARSCSDREGAVRPLDRARDRGPGRGR